jgi:hypothetical protein
MPHDALDEAEAEHARHEVLHTEGKKKGREE